MSNKPLWISIEGIDGSGKTTAVKYLKEKLENKGLKVKTLSGLGSGEVGEVIRKVYLNNEIQQDLKYLYMFTALCDTYKKAQSYLNDGNYVITDRFMGSFYAYNIIAENDKYAVMLFRNTYLLNKDFIKPNIDILIDVDIKEAKLRLEKRSGLLNYLDEKDDSYFNSVKSGYELYYHLIKSNNKEIVENKKNIEDFLNSLDELVNLFKL